MVRQHMSELEDTLKRISHDFAHQIIEALRQLPVEALYEELELDAPPPPAPARAAPSETEVSILEHLNEAGPTGSTVRAWVISTQGELSADEHDRYEREANAVLDALEAKGLIQKRAFSKSRGQVYALAPV
jgi:hypothetical protein